jgi:hypothetical protein
VRVDIAVKAIPTIGKAGKKVLVPLSVGAVVAVGAGLKGAVDTVNGHRTRKEALKRFDDAISECETTRLETERGAEEYGAFQIVAHKQTVGRFADWLERNEQLVRRLNFETLGGVRVEVPDVPKYRAGVESVTTGISGLAGAIGAGASAQAAALWGVSTFASASSGTAISTLSGAAAQNAILAWFGGGSLAAGGGGAAAGGVVLGLVSVVPGLLVGGMTMGVVGARTKTKARKFAATVELEIERIGLANDLLYATDCRIAELRDLLGRMTERATDALAVLDALNFDPDLHASEFLRSLQLVTAVKEIMNTPVLDPESGELTETSIQILRKYA